MDYFREKEFTKVEIQSKIQKNWDKLKDEFVSLNNLYMVYINYGWQYSLSVWKKCDKCGNYQLVDLNDPERKFRIEIIQYKKNLTDDKDLGTDEEAYNFFVETLGINLLRIEDINSCECNIVKRTREDVKKEISEFIKEYGNPDIAYYYDSCELTFEYDGKLCNKCFEYWDDGENLQYDYENLLKELNILCPVIEMNYREWDEEDVY